MKRLVALLIFGVVAAGLYVGPAQAGTDWHRRSVRVVDDDLRHGWCRWGHARYHSIQEAVNVSGDGDVILVCPGTYPETVTVDETLTLTILGAKAGQDARWRDQTKESVITPPLDDEGNPHGDPAGLVQLSSDGITWDGFLIQGNHEGPGMATSPRHSGYCIRNTVFVDNGIGLDLASDGEREVDVVNNRFTANNEVDPFGGYGIYSSRGVADVLIADNLFELHNGAGILFADNLNPATRPQERVRIRCNKSVDDNSFVTLYASTDVQVVANTVRSEKTFTDPASAIFVGARNSNILVKANHVKSANGNGIDVRNSGAPDNPWAPPENVDVLKNKVAGAKGNGIDLAVTGTKQYEVRGNLAVRNDNVGIHVGGREDPDLPITGPVDAILTRNTALDNVILDCQDETPGAETEDPPNLWQDNVGDSASPAGICGLQPLNDHDDHHGKHKHHKKRHHKKHPKYDEWCECLRTGRY